MELLNVKRVAELLGCSTRSVWRLTDSGKLPRPLRVGNRMLRWRGDDLRAWIDAGCPSALKREGGR